MTNSSSSRRALILQRSLSPFGNMLIQSGYVDSDQMHNALVESRRTGHSLTDILETLTGRQLSPELLRQYKKQQLFELKILYGVESLDPELNDISATQISHLIDTLIPIDACRRHRLLPLSQESGETPSLLVAMVDPENLEAQDDLNRILRPRNLALRRMVITTEDYQRLMSAYLDEAVARQKKQELDAAVDVSASLEELDYRDDSLAEVVDNESDLGEALKDAGAAPIIALVNKIMVKALQEGASDIHIEPQEEFLRVRFRKDGVLKEALPRMPKKIVPAVIARFKIISDLKIDERRLPQDGRVRRVFQGRKVDFRVSTLPSRCGEKVVLRILDNTTTELGLDKFVTDPNALKSIQDMASRPFGLILVTGPTGSGKTTTLYSMLSERNNPGINISTVEDPIEYTLPGLTQVQVIREKGMDFPSVLRSFLRQDPDVILVGETRDPETAKTAIEAALTGHLVLTTLHTNDAAGAIARLDEMGVELFMVSSALIGILAQRLVRQVCRECRIPYHPSPEQLGRFGLSAAMESDITFYQARTLMGEEIAEAKAQNKLCPTCQGAGYKGRVGVYEVMRITERLQKLISEGAPTEVIKEAAVDEGMQTLLSYSLDLVRQGLTTLEEVERVTFSDSSLEAELKSRRKASLICSGCQAELHQDWFDCPYCLTRRFHDH